MIAKGLVVVLVNAAVCLSAACDQPQDSEITVLQIDTLSSGTQVILDSSGRDVPEWSLQLLLRIEVDSPSEEASSDVWDFDVDSRGRVLALISRRSQVRVFDVDGRFQTTLGREGSGPGELRFPERLFSGPDDEVWISDPMNSRWTIFDKNGAYSRSLPRLRARNCRPGCGDFDALGRRIDGWLQPVAPSVFRNSWALIQGDTVVSTITIPLVRIEVPSTQPRPFPPFYARSIQAPDITDGVWFAYTDQYRLHRLSWNGDTSIISTLQVPRSALSASEVNEAREGIREAGEQSGMKSIGPEEASAWRPPISQIEVDDLGQVWVARTSTEDGTTRFWDVFSRHGIRVAAVPLSEPLLVNPVGAVPMQPRPIVIQGDKLYSLAIDEDGRQRILVWGIDRNR